MSHAPEPAGDSPLAAMVSAVRDGAPVDRDALRDALIARAVELGLPRREVARFAGRARWNAERQKGNSGEEG